MKKTHKLGKTVLLLFLGGIAALVMLHAVNRLQMKRQLSRQTILRQGLSLAQLTASAISLNLESAGHQLGILAKFRELSSFKRETLLAPAIEAVSWNLQLVADALAMDLAEAYRQQLEFKQNIEYWQQLLEALWRRFSYELIRLGGIIPIDIDVSGDSDEDSADSESILPEPDFDKISKPEFYRETRWAFDFIVEAKWVLKQVFGNLILVAVRIEELIDLGHTVLENQLAGEKFLSTAINNRRWFAGIRAVNIFGHSLVSFSETGIDTTINDYEICKKFASGKKFWVGNAFFSDNKTTYLQLAVPVKDRYRNVCGAIRAAFNLGTLKELFSSTRLGPNCEILVLDHEFNTILSSDPDRDLNRISFIKAIVDQSTVAKNRVSGHHLDDAASGRAIFMVPLSKFRKDNLPKWRIAVIQKRLEISYFSLNVPDFALFMLAVAGLYALCYSAVLLSRLYLQDRFE